MLPILSTIQSKYQYLTIDSICIFDTAVAEKRSRKIPENIFMSVELVFKDNRDREGHAFISKAEE